MIMNRRSFMKAVGVGLVALVGPVAIAENSYGGKFTIIGQRKTGGSTVHCVEYSDDFPCIKTLTIGPKKITVETEYPMSSRHRLEFEQNASAPVIEYLSIKEKR
jgi:hypothetical protein